MCIFCTGSKHMCCQGHTHFMSRSDILSFFQVSSRTTYCLRMQMPPLLKRLLKAALLLGAVAAIIASHAHSPAARWALAALTASYIGVSGYYKQRLDTSGNSTSICPCRDLDVQTMTSLVPLFC